MPKQMTLSTALKVVETRVKSDKTCVPINVVI